MKRILQWLIIVAVIIAALLFGTLNDKPVEVDFFFTTIQWPLAFSLLLFFLGGLLVSGVLVYFSAWRSFNRRLRAARRIEVAEATRTAQPSAATSLARNE